MPATEVISLIFDEPLERGKCYLLTGVLSGRVSGEHFQIRVGNDTTEEFITTIVTNGDFSVPIDYTASSPFYKFVSLTLFSNVNDTINFDITELSLKLDPECAQEYCSECFTLDNCGTNPTKEYLYLEWTNNDDGFGMNYTGVPLIHSLWLRAGLRNEDYPYTEDYFTTSGGTHFPVYVDSVKTVELWVDDGVPAYIHDALRLGIVHDEFTVNGVEYTKGDGGYSPDWDTPNSFLAPVIVKLREKYQDTRNENC